MPTKLKPAPTRFSFQIPGVRARFSVVEFSVTESISLPFQLDVRMTSKEDIPFEEVMNRPALLTVSKARSYRYFHGIINRFVYTEKSKDAMVYQARLVPSLWLLSLTQDCRVFQDKSVVEIVQTVLSQHPLSQSVEFRLKRHYPIMEFCAQFQESDVDFISRLLEQEGIFYFFEHSKTKHTLILADDRSSYLSYQDNASVVYTPDANENPGQDGIEEFLVTRNMYSGKVTLKDYNFQAPNKNLTYQAQAGTNQEYEIYHYPGRYKDGYGKTLAQIRLQEMTTFKGGGGSNELRFEDKKGAEEIYLHAEKDLTIAIENDKDETIGTSELTQVGLNRTTMVGRDLNETITGSKRISVGLNHSETLGGRVSVSAGKDWNRSIGGNLTEEVSKSCMLSANKIVFSAKEEICLKTGTASIILKKNGNISVKGKSIMITGSGDVVIKGKNVLSI